MTTRDESLLRRISTPLRGLDVQAVKRIDGKAVHGAAPRGGRAPMLVPGIWDDGTTAAQLPVDVKTL